LVLAMPLLVQHVPNFLVGHQLKTLLAWAQLLVRLPQQ
jgi:hypothetical protein